jgi:hypothetical protein
MTQNTRPVDVSANGSTSQVNLIVDRNASGHEAMGRALVHNENLVSAANPLPITNASLPSTLGAKIAAQSFAVTLSTDGAFATAFGAATDAASATDTGNTGFISLFKRLFSKLPAALVNNRFAVDSVVRTAVTNPLQYAAIGTSAGANIKNTTGSLYSLSCLNSNASTRYVQLFNKNTAPVASDIPLESFAVYGNDGQLVLGQDYFTLNGIDFSTGISWGISTTRNLYTAATAADTIFTARYL